MFDRFGEMNTCEEINELAANLLKEGDIENLQEMARENGISDDYVEMYLNETIPVLCDVVMAAIGKVDVECAELKPKELMLDWVEYIKGLCLEYEEIARSVRQKGKSLKQCMAVLLQYSFANMAPVNKEIIEQVNFKGKKPQRVTFGVPGMAQAKRLIREYYLRDEAGDEA